MIVMYMYMIVMYMYMISLIGVLCKYGDIMEIAV